MKEVPAVLKAGNRKGEREVGPGNTHVEEEPAVRLWRDYTPWTWASWAVNFLTSKARLGPKKALQSPIRAHSEPGAVSG